MDVLRQRKGVTAMQSLWPMVVFGLVLAGAGVWELFVPLDVLWARRERHLLARGQTPLRNEVWENSARNGGLFAIFAGLFVALIPLMIQVSAPPKMSGVSINGRQLTQQEWDGCHHDMPTCLSAYYNR